MAEKGARPNVPRVQRLALRAVRAFSSPLLPDDYLELINPLWSTRELRGKIERIESETETAATVVIKPSYRFDGHEPGQYLRIGIDIKGRRHWRAYSLTSDPENEEGIISITVKNVDEGAVSPYLTQRRRASGRSSGWAASRATSCCPTRSPRSCSSSAPAAASRRSCRCCARSTTATR